jgi:hypothetical protein
MTYPPPDWRTNHLMNPSCSRSLRSALKTRSSTDAASSLPFPPESPSNRTYSRLSATVREIPRLPKKPPGSNSLSSIIPVSTTSGDRAAFRNLSGESGVSARPHGTSPDDNSPWSYIQTSAAADETLKRRRHALLQKRDHSARSVVNDATSSSLDAHAVNLDRCT